MWTEVVYYIIVCRSIGAPAAPSRVIQELSAGDVGQFRAACACLAAKEEKQH
jgi:hypothetical protein